MTNQEQLKVLQRGVRAWNAWRWEHPNIKIDLQEANLERADLRGANLTGAYLRVANLAEANLAEASLAGANLAGAKLYAAKLAGADLTGAILTGTLFMANLTEAKVAGAKLTGTDLQWAKLAGADLTGADLTWADLTRADLTRADLTRADLTWAKLTSAILTGTNMTDVRVDSTVFGDLNLSTVRGLDTLQHYGPSTVGIDTIYQSQGSIPEAFLRNAGIPDTFIEYMRSLTVRPIEYYSCFISYASKDQACVERLYTDLRAAGVRCWYAPEDLKIGERIRVGIDESIRLHDKLLLVLSKNSVASDWVEKEVETAMEKERQQKRTVLFPVRLDDAVMKIETGWPADIRRGRNIGDFRKWKHHDDYQKALQRLLRDLAASEQSKKA